MLRDFLPRLELARAQQRQAELRNMARAFNNVAQPSPEQIADIEKLEMGFCDAAVSLPEIPDTIERLQRVLGRAQRAMFGVIEAATARLCAAFDVAGVHHSFRSSTERDCALATRHDA